jgi:preprotein translocase subunit YajC
MATLLMTTFLTMFQGGLGGLGALGGLLPMLLIIGVFYMLLIRPQQKRQRELQQTISELKVGDRVVTTGGIIGTITTVRDTSFIIRSADKSILEVARSAIASIEGEEAKK